MRLVWIGHMTLYFLDEEKDEDEFMEAEDDPDWLPENTESETTDDDDDNYDDEDDCTPDDKGFDDKKMNTRECWYFDIDCSWRDS